MKYDNPVYLSLVVPGLKVFISYNGLIVCSYFMLDIIEEEEDSLPLIVYTRIYLYKLLPAGLASSRVNIMLSILSFAIVKVLELSFKTREPLSRYI